MCGARGSSKCAVASPASHVARPSTCSVSVVSNTWLLLGDLLLGRRREHFHATEVVDSDKEEILRAYLRRWTWEVGQFFPGVGPESSSADLDRIAPDHPIFRIDG